MSPASGDPAHNKYQFKELPKVSIQLMSPASGDYVNHVHQVLDPGVSIQLMSPASGDKETIKEQCSQGVVCFHSINVPSEWGPDSLRTPKYIKMSFPFN